ncbi:hypothetical protein ZWY2020_045159 [Hordeum vulgare]|nr:hypothetical protein ZWY2020_045159 [Hordeum vulgare]
MVVLVKNTNNASHMYCSIMQRVTDGKVGVLFEGGNWDRLITFGVDGLEGRAKGPAHGEPQVGRARGAHRGLACIIHTVVVYFACRR